MNINKKIISISFVCLLVWGCSAGGNGQSNSANSGGSSRISSASFGNINNNESLVSLSPNILVEFNTSVSNVTPQNIVFIDGQNVISSNIIAYNNSTYMVSPSINLESNSQYSLIVESGILDNLGNNINTVKLNFTTGNTVNPVLINSIPTNIDPESSLNLLFNLNVSDVSGGINLFQIGSGNELIPYPFNGVTQLSLNNYQLDFTNNYILPHNQYKIVFESGINSYGNQMDIVESYFTVGNNVKFNFTDYPNDNQFEILHTESNCNNMWWQYPNCYSICTVDYKINLNIANIYKNESITLAPNSNNGSFSPSACTFDSNNKECTIIVKGAKLNMQYIHMDQGSCTIYPNLRNTQLNFNIVNSNISTKYIESGNLSLEIYN